MRYSDKTVKELLDQINTDPKGHHLVYTKSEFSWSQLVHWLKKHYELVSVTDGKQVMALNSGLFKHTIACLDFHKDLPKTLLGKQSQVGALIRVKDKSSKVSLQVATLVEHNREDIVNALIEKLGEKRIQVEPRAVSYGIDNMDANSLIHLLDFIGLRDGGLVSYNAVVYEVSEFENNAFALQDALLALDRTKVNIEFNGLISTNAPHKILATLTTLTKRILQALQANSMGANANQLASKCGCSPGAAMNAIKKIKAPGFEPVRVALLYNTLIGLTLQLQRKHSTVTLPEEMKLSLFKYLCDSGYTGT